MKDTIAETRRRKATLTELASRVPQEHFETLKQNLAALDKDKTGKVNYDGFVMALKAARMNATMREVDVLIKELDTK
jgi:Ca2+-binding EF-hand superfamily protein